MLAIICGAEGKYFVNDSRICHKVVSATLETTRCGVEVRGRLGSGTGVQFAKQSGKTGRPYSSELADHLETLREYRICFVLSVTYDAILEAKRYRIIEIGRMTRWKSS